MDIADIDLASVDHVLMTTRAVRKRLDLTRPVERELIERCIEIAIQAPTALYGETWHFIVITDATQRAAVAEIYRRAGAGVRSGAFSLDPYTSSLRATSPDDKRFTAQQKMFSAGAELMKHLSEVPVLILACAEGRVENAGPGRTGSAVRLDFSCRVVVDVGVSRSWHRVRPHHLAYRTLRARHGPSAGVTRQYDPSGACGSRLFYRHRF